MNAQYQWDILLSQHHDTNPCENIFSYCTKILKPFSVSRRSYVS